MTCTSSGNCPSIQTHTGGYLIVEATVLNLKPGDTLVVQPKVEVLDMDMARTIQECFEFWFPHARIIVAGGPMELAVVPASDAEDHPGDVSR